jgi:hypothetical protein
MNMDVTSTQNLSFRSISTRKGINLQYLYFLKARGWLLTLNIGIVWMDTDEYKWGSYFPFHIYNVYLRLQEFFSVLSCCLICLALHQICRPLTSQTVK